MNKSLSIELFKDEDSKPYTMKAHAIDMVYFEGGDKSSDTFNRIRIVPFGESTRRSEHMLEITMTQNGDIHIVIPEGSYVSQIVGNEIKITSKDGNNH